MRSSEEGLELRLVNLNRLDTRPSRFALVGVATPDAYANLMRGSNNSRYIRAFFGAASLTFGVGSVEMY